MHQAIAELPDSDLRQGLINLQAAEFLYEVSLFPDLEYTFKHALTHEVAYGGVLQERRRALHGRIVDAIEALYADRLAEQVERLAHHAYRAETWEKAASYLRRAGDKAWALLATGEALNAFEHALTALGHLPEAREHLEQGVDLRLLLCSVLDALTDPARSLRYGNVPRDGHAVLVGKGGSGTHSAQHEMKCARCDAENEDRLKFCEE